MAKTVADQFAETLAAVVTVEMAKGFTLYMVMAVMNGRRDEVIDLARFNPRR